MIKQVLKLSILLTITYFGCSKSSGGSNGGGTTTNNATVASLNCSSATFSNTFTNGTVANNVLITIPYASGNGGKYSAISIPSTGVTGLTATASADSVKNGNGNLVLTVNGTPTNSGTANFLVNFGGKSCTVSATVGGTIGAAILTLKCADINTIQGGTITNGIVATNIPVDVLYNNGNGGSYPALNISSTGITGLTASLSAGNVVNGPSGYLNFKVSGVPSNFGKAYFFLSIGGQTCTFSVNVQKQLLNKSLLTNAWWNSQKSSPFYPTHFFNSNGVYHLQKLGSYLDTGTWNWGTNDTIFYKQKATSPTYFYVIDKLTIDTLVIRATTGTTEQTFVK